MTNDDTRHETSRIDESIDIIEEFTNTEWADAMRVAHDPNYFIVEIGQTTPPNKIRYFLRVVVPPRISKIMLKTWEDNIKMYEEKFGEIEV